MNKGMEFIGGRKMLLTLLVIAIGAVVEVTSRGGLSVNFAGLLVGVLTAFSAANAAITVGGKNPPKTNEDKDVYQVNAVELDEPKGTFYVGAEPQPVIGPAYDRIQKLEDNEAVNGPRLEALEARMDQAEQALETATKLIKVLMQVRPQGQ